MPGDLSWAHMTGFLLLRLRNRRQYFGSIGKACTVAIDEILTKAP